MAGIATEGTAANEAPSVSSNSIVCKAGRIDVAFATIFAFSMRLEAAQKHKTYGFDLKGP
jgi:hypothetical protein